MTINEYQKKVLITEKSVSTSYPRILYGLMGLTGSNGCALSLLQRFMFQGHKIDRLRLARELAHVAHYLAVSAEGIGYSLDEILTMDIEHLKLQYPYELT